MGDDVVRVSRLGIFHAEFLKDCVDGKVGCKFGVEYPIDKSMLHVTVQSPCSGPLEPLDCEFNASCRLRLRLEGQILDSGLMKKTMDATDEPQNCCEKLQPNASCKVERHHCLDRRYRPLGSHALWI